MVLPDTVPFPRPEIPVHPPPVGEQVRGTMTSWASCKLLPSVGHLFPAALP